MPLSYKLAIKIAKDFGFVIIRQKGSHQQFRKDNYTVTIPVKKEFPIGTGISIIKEIANINNIDVKIIIQKYKIKL